MTKADGGGRARLQGDGQGAEQTGQDGAAPQVPVGGQPASVARGERPGGGAAGPVELAERWLAGLEGKVTVPASDVQDHLLDLWGALEEGPARSEVERWLTETLRRSMYSVPDINDRLEALLPAP